jgi:hypothetical protein
MLLGVLVVLNAGMKGLITELISLYQLRSIV